MYIIAAASVSEWLLVILQVGLGLGAVIFVHELGHFAVAKMCGVKCDKFFIGFDIGGYKISRRWGETEYGIGILPLGGYVKMLGQDDNPSHIAEQMRESQASVEGTVATKEVIGPDGKHYTVDQRSYLAKTVPQRMAIISAGVIMNVIFAFVFAVIAYGLGVPYTPCIVSSTALGSAAYQAAIRPGDEILAVEDVENPSFSELMGGVTLGDLQKGVSFTVRRAGTGEVETILLKPEQRGDELARVGIFSPRSLRLAQELPFRQHTPAARASADFQGGDEVIRVNGQDVRDYREYTSRQVQLADQPLEIVVRRGGQAPAGDPWGPRQGGQEIAITVPTRPWRRLGLVMEMGKIVAVEQGTAAAARGLQAGDFIEQVAVVERTADPAGRSSLADDPLALPRELRRLARELGEVRLTVRRSSASADGRQLTETIDLPLREATWLEQPMMANDPLSIPALGIAYRVLNRVDSALPGSPAARAGLQRGDVILQAEYLVDDQVQERWLRRPVEFGTTDNHNWPVFMRWLQDLPASAQVKLTYKRGAERRQAILQPEVVPGEFVTQRGLVFAPVKRIRKARTFQEQLRLGYQETWNSLGMVLRFLGKLGTQIPFSSLGGPVTIAQVAGYSAFEGMGKLLVFLTMLSANLAVINFLPIPLLDGGHMVFLVWEGIRGRPASERFVMALHTLGFLLVISLMLFVFALDIRRLIGLD